MGEKCIFILEVIMFIIGVWTIIKTKLPLFISAPHFRVEGDNARLLGVILLLPLPVASVINFFLSIFLDKETALTAAIFVDPLVILIVLITTYIFILNVGERIT